MAADVLGNLYSWSTTAGSNQPAGSTTISTNLDDNLREIQKVVRYTQSRDTIASASTCDLGTKEAMSLDVTGTTTITSFGTVSAGIRKWVTFADALTLTYNATSLKLPTAASLTTAAGDKALFESLGSGNWQCLSYLKANGQTVASSTTFGDGTVSLPGIAFTSDTNTGIYRIGADNIGIALGGTKYLDISSTAVALSAPFSVSGTGTYSLGNAVSFVTSSSAGAGASGITIATGATAAGTSGSVVMKTGNDSTTGTSGSFAISTGNGYTTAGTLSITAGSTTVGGATANTAASINITSGSVNSTSNGNAGDIVLQLGAGNGDVGATDGVIKFKTTYNGTQYSIATVRNKEKVWAWDTNGGAPTIFSGGGTGATIAGTNYGFTVTAGTTPGTTFTVQLDVGQSPSIACAVASSSNTGYTVATSLPGFDRVTVTTSSSMTAGDKISVMVSYYV